MSAKKEKKLNINLYEMVFFLNSQIKNIANKEGNPWNKKNTINISIITCY